MAQIPVLEQLVAGASNVKVVKVSDVEGIPTAAAGDHGKVIGVSSAGAYVLQTLAGDNFFRFRTSEVVTADKTITSGDFGSAFLASGGSAITLTLPDPSATNIGALIFVHNASSAAVSFGTSGGSGAPSATISAGNAGIAYCRSASQWSLVEMASSSGGGGGLTSVATSSPISGTGTSSDPVTIADKQISGAKLADNTVGETQIGANAVDVSELKTTDAGTTGQVLTRTDTGQNWADAPSGGTDNYADSVGLSVSGTTLTVTIGRTGSLGDLTSEVTLPSSGGGSLPSGSATNYLLVWNGTAWVAGHIAAGTGLTVSHSGNVITIGEGSTPTPTTKRYTANSTDKEFTEAEVKAGREYASNINMMQWPTFTEDGYIAFLQDATLTDIQTLVMDGIDQIGAFIKNPDSNDDPGGDAHQITIDSVAYNIWRSENLLYAHIYSDKHFTVT